MAYPHLAQLGDDVIAIESTSSKGIYKWDNWSNKLVLIGTLKKQKMGVNSNHVKITTRWLDKCTGEV